MGFNSEFKGLTNKDYARSCQKYSSTNDIGLLFDAWAVTE